ncbi:MAG: TonB-dependent receptor [Flavihumibacter sp.]
MKNFSLLLAALICSMAALSQNTLRGRISDSSSKAPLTGATVQLKNSNTTRNAVTARGGVFNITDIPDGSYKLTISFVGYTGFEQTLTFDGKPVDLGTIPLKKGSDNLEEVVVKGITPPAQQKGDTIQFNASQFKVNADANIEDLVKKMPGVQVSNGTVTAQGETVKKVTIDGREFFGDDASAALRNLPADVVDKIQVFDRLSDQAQLTGIDDGNGYKTINVVTRADRRNGQFGRVYAGYGTDDRYQAGGAVNFFKKNRRLSVVGLFNNINQQNFAGSDILGLTGSGSGRGGGGAGRGGPGGGGGNFTVNNSGGITTTNSLGVNYSDLWGKNVNVTGSYFFNNGINENNTVSNRELFNSGDSSTFYKETGFNRNKSSNHRVNLRMEYAIDSNNMLIITPSINLQHTDNTSSTIGSLSGQSGAPISTTDNRNHTTGNGVSFNNMLMFRHSFAKKGRSLVLGLNTAVNNRESMQDVSAISSFFKAGTEYDSVLQQQQSTTKSYTLGGNIAYTEPVGKKGVLQFSYNPSYTYSDADQKTYKFDGTTDKYSVLDTSLSNVFDNRVTTHRGGVTYRMGNRDKNVNIGFDLQSASLNSNQTYPQQGNIKRSFFNILPNAMARFNFSTRSSIRLFYRASTSNPSVGQLQNVINNSNTLFLTTGNAGLGQSVSNRLGGRFTYTNNQKGNSFFVNFFGTQTDGFITNATYQATADSVLTPSVTLYQGSQLSKPINLNGYWNTNTMLTYLFPLKFMKSNLTINGGLAYLRTPGMINNLQNVSNSYTYSGGLGLTSNISEYVDFNLNYNSSYNNVTNKVQQSLNNHYFSQSAGVGINLASKNGWVFQNDLNNQLYRGLSASYNQNFWLWNIAVGKKFLKDQKGDLRLSVFDLLKQNRSITRTVSASYIEDLQTQVLTQYFMLTFTYRIKNFGKATQQRQQRDGPPGDMPPGMSPGMGRPPGDME